MRSGFYGKRKGARISINGRLNIHLRSYLDATFDLTWLMCFVLIATHINHMSAVYKISQNHNPPENCQKYFLWREIVQHICTSVYFRRPDHEY